MLLVKILLVGEEFLGLKLFEMWNLKEEFDELRRDLFFWIRVGGGFIIGGGGGGGGVLFDWLRLLEKEICW